MSNHGDYYKSFETLLYALGLDWHAMECLPRMGGDVMVFNATYAFSIYCFPYAL